MKSRILLRGLLVVWFVLIASACNTSPSKPSVIIVSPPSGSVFQSNDEIKVQAVATDAAGVTRVELLVDNEIVKVDPSPTAQGQPNFNLVQSWKATQGAHTLVVRAYNAAGVASDPVAISVNVTQALAPATPTLVALVPTATPVPNTATATSTVVPGGNPPLSPGQPSAVPQQPTCTDNSVYISDVTIQDGTQLSANQAFNKTWRISNNGTCAWDTGYQFVFVSGEAMATTTVLAVPKTAVGASVDLTVPMVAPTTPGLHSGQWKLRNANGSLFGQSVTVKVNVINPAPPQAVTCSGTPSIASFTASPTSILLGGTTTLSWGLVSNAEAVEIDHGIGGVATPGSIKVSPGSDTTYTLTAKCGANTKTAQVTIKVTKLIPVTLVPPIIKINWVTGVTVVGNSNSQLIVCPRSYTFTGTITANGAFTVNYTWERDNGNGPSGSVKFDAAGSKNVTYNYSATSSDTYGTVQLHVTSPNNITSNTASYSCTKLVLSP